MMILAEIYVPALNRQYDFKLDENAYIADILEELGETLLPQPENEGEEDVRELLLCSYEREKILALDKTLRQEGFGNGSRLVLI